MGSISIRFISFACKPNNKPELPMKKPANQRRFILGAMLLLGATLAALVQHGLVVAAQPADAASDATAARSKSAAAAPAAGREADEKAIRATADDFLKAFNAADAKAVGALWASDAEYTDESGQSLPRPRRDRELVRRAVQGTSWRDHDGHHRVDPLPRTRHRRGERCCQAQVANR